MGMKDTTKVQTEEVTLEFMRRYVATVIPDSHMMNVERIRLEMQPMLERMANQLVLCEDLPIEPLKEFEATAHFYHPSSWWQHFKKDIAPKWFIERFPIKDTRHTRKVTVKMAAAYPRLPVAFPKYGEYKFVYTQAL